MKFFHISDLHFGKQLCGYDLSEEHREFIEQLVAYISSEKPDAILISGDIYDKSVPSAAAMTMLDELLLLMEGVPVLIIAGNHDSAERLRYGRHFLEKHNIFISVMPPQDTSEKLKKVTLKDKYGDVNIYMLPFLKPGMVRHFMPDEAAKGEQAVIEKLLENENIDFKSRNVIMSHQFYLPKKIDKDNALSKSEDTLPLQNEDNTVSSQNEDNTVSPQNEDNTVLSQNEDNTVSSNKEKTSSVGGTDAVSASVLDGFDYAALGHIHKAYALGDERFRYCGSPIKLSVSEAEHIKGITLIEMGKKNEEIIIKTLPLKNKRDVRTIKGNLIDVIAQSNINNRSDYISITLTDDNIPEQVKEQLLAYYDNILEVAVDNKRTRQILSEDIADFKELTPYEAFAEFFKEVSGRALNEDENKLIKEIIEEVSGD